MNADNEIQTFLKPDYLFWIRKGKWNLKESILLLLEMEPRRFSEEGGVLEEIKKLSEKEPEYLTEVIDKTSDYEDLFLSGPFSMLSLKRDRKLSFWDRAEKEAFFKDYTVECKRVLEWAIQMKLGIPDGLATEAVKFKILERDHFLNVDWDYYLNLVTWSEEIGVVLMRGLSFDSEMVNLGLKGEDRQEFVKFAEILRSHLNYGNLKSHQKMDNTGIHSVGYEIPVQDFLMWAQGKGFLVPKRLREEAQKINQADQKSPKTDDDRPLQHQKEKPIRAHQEHKARARAIASLLWSENPDLTIEDVINSDQLNKFGCEGASYNEKTIRGWINDLSPNRNPGRRPQKL